MKAVLKNYRQSPRKVRLVADFVRGKSVPRAKTELNFLTKRAADPIATLLDSAVANAKQNDGLADSETLFVKDIQIGEGLTLKRFIPRARGRATPINKRTSHIFLELGVRKSAQADQATVTEAQATPAQNTQSS